MLKRGKKVNRSKKGISPLIATVLIIGFTIILGVFVYMWGIDLFRSQISKTSETSEVQLVCADTAFNIKTACIFGGKINLYLENVGQQDINSFRYRVIGKDSYSNDFKNGLPLFSTSYTKFPIEKDIIGIKSIEIFPEIIVNEEPHYCNFPVKKDLKDCYTLLGFKAASNFHVDPVYTATEVLNVSLGTEKAKEEVGGFFLTDLAIGESFLIMYSQNGILETNPITITSDSFIIPNDPAITHIAIYSEAKGMKVTYSIKEFTNNNLGNDIITPITIDALGTVDSVSYKLALPDNDNNGINDYVGKSAKLIIQIIQADAADLESTIGGYTNLYRFCYTDNTGICLV